MEWRFSFHFGSRNLEGKQLGDAKSFSDSVYDVHWKESAVIKSSVLFQQSWFNADILSIMFYIVFIVLLGP